MIRNGAGKDIAEAGLAFHAGRCVTLVKGLTAFQGGVPLPALTLLTTTPMLTGISMSAEGEGACGAKMHTA